MPGWAKQSFLSLILGIFPPSSRSCKGKVEASSSEKAPLTWEITQSCHADHLGSPPISSRAEPSLPHLPLPWRKEAAPGTSASFPGRSHVVHSVLATALALGPSRALHVPVKGQPGQGQWGRPCGWLQAGHRSHRFAPRSDECGPLDEENCAWVCPGFPSWLAGPPL